MTARRFPVVLVGLVWLLLLSACQPDPHTAQGTAELFLDAHYVRIDLPTAKSLLRRLCPEPGRGGNSTDRGLVDRRHNAAAAGVL